MPPGKPRAGFQQETLIYTENTTLTGSEGDAPAVCGLAGVPGRMEAKRSLGAGPALSSGTSSVQRPGAVVCSAPRVPGGPLGVGSASSFS